MQRIPCATIWGGIREESIDVCSRSVEASLYASAAEGGKGGDIYRDRPLDPLSAR